MLISEELEKTDFELLRFFALVLYSIYHFNLMSLFKEYSVCFFSDISPVYTCKEPVK